jgi:hypothetical protein
MITEAEEQGAAMEAAPAPVENSHRTSVHVVGHLSCQCSIRAIQKRLRLRTIAERMIIGW